MPQMVSYCISIWGNFCSFTHLRPLYNHNRLTTSQPLPPYLCEPSSSGRVRTHHSVWKSDCCSYCCCCSCCCYCVSLWLLWMLFLLFFLPSFNIWYHSNCLFRWFSLILNLFNHINLQFYMLYIWRKKKETSYKKCVSI